MQLREILDLDAMLTKDPAPESLSDDEDGDDNGEISEKTAGPSYKEEEDVEEESSDDEEDSMTERRAKRPVDDEEEDNRSEERRVGQECVSTCRSRVGP